MFIRQLEYLVTLAKEKHFARAADACHVSQPALSTAIRTLESELGVTIVNRGRRFVGFTEDGERVLGWARQTLATLQNMRQDASAAQARLVGTLRVGAIPTVMPVTSRIFAACMQQHPHIRYEVHSLSSDAIHRQLDDLELDIGLTYLDSRVQAGFSVMPLYRERYILLSPPHARAESTGSTRRWDTLGTVPLGLLPATMQNRQAVNAAFRRENVQPTVVVETDSLLALYAHVLHAGLFSIFPHSLLGVLPAGNDVGHSLLEPELTREIGLVTRNREALPPLVSAMWRSAERLDLQAEFDALLPGAFEPAVADVTSIRRRARATGDAG
ncbi:LysR family transcriptional regulator [Paraburkholderia saeva]|uniref:HTH-type transcriptional regulator HdfR n=1 Tax=Paraburkholderia saeva TaxID=2777537 RepID=A0A9N8X4U9_9BURK|nr:LysR family transcriptional regulator [Paraburkholderia saeva]CAG4889618.1 HTH-type transcriptional regulator HdfR [Paraburkholderia saeva]CAG4915729.1 HTH-type transcriptional regulator HdfR [Paraburkholderia saeva]